jgi:hypothetical protein
MEKLRMPRCNAPTNQGIRTSKATELPRKPLGTNPSAKPNENKAELPRLRASFFLGFGYGTRESRSDALRT